MSMCLSYLTEIILIISFLGPLPALTLQCANFGVIDRTYISQRQLFRVGTNVGDLAPVSGQDLNKNLFDFKSNIGIDQGWAII